MIVSGALEKPESSNQVIFALLFFADEITPAAAPPQIGKITSTPFFITASVNSAPFVASYQFPTILKSTVDAEFASFAPFSKYGNKTLFITGYS